MKILDILKRAGKVAQTASPIVSMFVPQSGPAIAIVGRIVEAVTMSVNQTEASVGAGNGSKKLATSLALVDSKLPEIIASFETLINKDVVDENELAHGIHDLTNSVVRIQNALRLLPKK